MEKIDPINDTLWPGIGGNTPRPIFHVVFVSYFISFLLDIPNWMLFEIEVRKLSFHIL